MFETDLKIKFKSDWHVGSGLGDGAIADAALARDWRGIPHIPGSAIKGALREGSWRLGLWDRQWQTELPNFIFGTAQAREVTNHPGVVTVGTGSLPRDLLLWLESLDTEGIEQAVRDMTQLRVQTALDEKRQVVAHSLRTIECGIPGLVFTASFMADVPDECHAWFADYLGAICASVKSIGGDRSRGLGHCEITSGSGAGKRLPGPIPEALLKRMEKARI